MNIPAFSRLARQSMVIIESMSKISSDAELVPTRLGS